ncbi:hypothetical protein IHC92_17290 [Photobacterium damselae subsp. damselae]|uniref:hypothetical protein n=1 Tax=Photobacterium damselae TaxID=38293 RepID=UPI001F24335B|nr:hypothetical protein [Photobacterium damselae]UKA07755.1 hypothetical protein IHC90_17905 [Photobacterium damselae subsp. damselae]UKA23917.1 hypothetical protein IHC92_17290 [Photobacterium damselae subsp. damselae]
MALDTRGVMDGAMRGFGLMDSYFTNKERKEEETRRYNDSLRRADERAKIEQERYDKDWTRNEERYQEQKAREDERLKNEKMMNNHRLKVQQAQLAASTYQLERNKKNDFIKDNIISIDKAWLDYSHDGEVDALLDNPYIKGTYLDIRTYTPEKVKAFETAQQFLSNPVDGKYDIDALIPELAIIYNNDIKSVVGQKDAEGKKTITDATLSRIHLASDINPEIAGDQPGLVFGVTVTYDDGTTAIKPVTEMRSSNLNDRPRVVPIDEAMKDLSSRMKLARVAATSPYYSKIFSPDYKKEQTQFNKERLKILSKAETDFAKNKADIENNNPGMSEEERQAKYDALDKQHKETIERINQLYGVSDDSTEGDHYQKILGAFVKKYPTEATHLTEFTQWAKQNGYDLTPIFSNLKNAENFYAAYKQEKKILDKKQAEENAQARIKTITSGSKSHPSEGLSDVEGAKYQSMSDDELMKLTQAGDKQAWATLYERRSIARGGLRQAPLPGRTTDEERDLANKRLQRYQQLISEGRIKEANQALTSGTVTP